MAEAGKRRLFISDPDENAPASPIARLLLWAVLALAALVAIFAA